MTYTTIAGDMWDLIAYKTLGDCKYVETLINANREYLDTFIFDAGIELEIPDVTTEQKAVNLPPWRT